MILSAYDRKMAKDRVARRNARLRDAGFFEDLPDLDSMSPEELEEINKLVAKLPYDRALYNRILDDVFADDDGDDQPATANRGLPAIIKLFP